MTTLPDRNEMADEIVAILKASTKDGIKDVTDENIRYGLRTITQMFAVEPRGREPGMVFVAPGASRYPQKTMGHGTQRFEQDFEIQVALHGHDPETDQKLAVTIAQGVEEELFDTRNKELPSGGHFAGVEAFEPGPPVGRSNLTLHYVVMTVTYWKFTKL